MLGLFAVEAEAGNLIGLLTTIIITVGGFTGAIAVAYINRPSKRSHESSPAPAPSNAEHLTAVLVSVTNQLQAERDENAKLRQAIENLESEVVAWKARAVEV